MWLKKKSMERLLFKNIKTTVRLLMCTHKKTEDRYMLGIKQKAATFIKLQYRGGALPIHQPPSPIPDI